MLNVHISLASEFYFELTAQQHTYPCMWLCSFSGKAAVSFASSLPLQSVLSWTGDAFHSIPNEGLYMESTSYAHSAVMLWNESSLVDFFFPLQSGFKNHNSPWKSALIGVQKRNGSQVASSISLTLTIKDKTSSRKRVWLCFSLV